MNTLCEDKQEGTAKEIHHQIISISYQFSPNVTQLFLMCFGNIWVIAQKGKKK